MGDKTTPGTYEYFFQLWSDKGGKRTTVVVKGLLTAEKTLKALLREIYNDIPSSLWTIEDRALFRRKTGLPHTVTRHKIPIEEKCNPIIIPLGGGFIQFACKTTTDSSRPSLPALANGVEVAYKIGIPHFTTEDTKTMKAGTRIRSQMLSPNDNTSKEIVTKAKFILKLGTEHAGKDLHVFIRWINAKHPQMSGPWTGPWTTTIL